jgi:hypothetical protein
MPRVEISEAAAPASCRAIVSTRVRELSFELGQQLLKNYKDSEHSDSLGVFDVLATELD